MPEQLSRWVPTDGLLTGYPKTGNNRSWNGKVPYTKKSTFREFPSTRGETRGKLLILTNDEYTRVRLLFCDKFP